jgi:hypothetical protein
MEISLHGEQLVIALECPLDSLLRFEHAPRNASRTSSGARPWPSN